MADEATTVREVKAFYQRYVEAWNRGDSAALAQCYDRPHVGVSGEHGLSLVDSDAEHESWYQRVMAYERRFERSGIAGTQVWPLSSSLAQLVADINRFGRNGEVVQRARVTYMLRRVREGWKVTTYAVVEEPFDGPGHPRTERLDQ